MIWAPLVLGYYYFTINFYRAFVNPLALVLMLLPVTLIVLTAKTPRENILALKLTSYSALTYAVLVAWGLAVPL
jgi:1,4-dihydroxy-2-naphthoate octaprenyltransferase